MHTSISTIATRLVFTGKQEVKLEEFESGQPGETEVLVETHLSLMSTGTENIVFNRLFDPGTHWDGWVKYPFYPGYTSVGEVIATGPGVRLLKVGDRIAYRAGHASHAIKKAAECYPIPVDLQIEHAVWFALAKIAYHGALAAEFRLGDSVMIIGAGPIGQMAVRWANAAGTDRILAVDTAEKRLVLASAGGATAVIAEPIGSAREAILAANDGRLPRMVIDSTGNAVVFSAALGLVADRGTLVLLGDTGQPSQQKLSSDVITRGLRIVGAHDAHVTEKWNDATITQLFFRMISTGRFSLDGMNTHRFVPEQCKEAYETANRDRALTMGIVFDWSKP
jgi:2-desacetyl-2-hydroxyethyl bacteriochlorophyllide A dehydrogenase